MKWTNLTDQLPEENVVVDTILSDERGDRNHQPLKRVGNLWFAPDGSMYVYYTPTMWRYLDDGA